MCLWIYHLLRWLRKLRTPRWPRSQVLKNLRALVYGVSTPARAGLLPPPILAEQSGKYNEMDPILIGAAASEHVIREMSKPAGYHWSKRWDKR